MDGLRKGRQQMESLAYRTGWKWQSQKDYLPLKGKQTRYTEGPPEGLRDLRFVICPSSIFGCIEQMEWDQISHRFVAKRRWVEVVARIIVGAQAIWLLRVFYGNLEVDDRVKVTTGSNPLIYGLPISLIRWFGMVVLGSSIGQDRSAIDEDVLLVGSADDLLIRCNDVANQCFVLCCRDLCGSSESTEVVYALKKDQVSNTQPGDNIPIKTGHGIGSQPVVQ